MLARAFSPLQRVGAAYASVSTERPHAVAGLTASGIISSADVTCQLLFQRDAAKGLDWQRTLSLTAFAAWHYGAPAKYLYLTYDKVLGRTAYSASAAAALKMGFDVYVHSPLLLVPSFYLITGTVKGQTLAQTLAQLRNEWLEASFGTAVFWTPLCYLNFRLVPQHSRILFVSVGSFLHKTWLSHLSNRARHRERAIGSV